ncbi:MAG TPA: carboxypeptidase regulatory-like domain-containing protein [Gemmatimonadaceae bacterium]
MSRLHFFRRILLSVAAGSLIGAAAAAQTPPDSAARVDSLARQDSTARADTARRLGVILGSVYDSVHYLPLSGAAVLVEGTTRMGFTNERGAFAIDSVPAGQYRVRVEHPVLDSLGIQMLTDPFRLGDGEQHLMELAVPSSETIVILSCPAAVRRLGPGAIIGRVLDADTDAPVPSVRVTYAWQQLSLTGTNVRMEPRVRGVNSGPDGVFRICGLPNDIEGTLLAERGPIKTAEVKIAFQGQTLIVQGMRIGSEATVTRLDPDSLGDSVRVAQSRLAAPVAQRGEAILTGRVLAANGQPMEGARVNVLGAPGAALTNANGEFRLTELPSGTQVVEARQIGFAPVQQTVNLSTRAPTTVTITMTQPAQVLAPVVVEAEEDRGLERLGFTERKRALSGYFLDADEIMARGPNLLTDVFRTVPSLRVVKDGLYDYKVESARANLLGPNCVRFFIDRQPYQQIYPGDIDRIMPPSQVAAIEVYTGSAAPIEFQVAGSSACTTVVVWSKFATQQANRRRR